VFDRSHTLEEAHRELEIIKTYLHNILRKIVYETHSLRFEKLNTFIDTCAKEDPQNFRHWKESIADLSILQKEFEDFCENNIPLPSTFDHRLRVLSAFFLNKSKEVFTSRLSSLLDTLKEIQLGLKTIVELSSISDPTLSQELDQLDIHVRQASSPPISLLDLEKLEKRLDSYKARYEKFFQRKNLLLSRLLPQVLFGLKS
jgi:Rad3-related DNA helicase